MSRGGANAIVNCSPFCGFSVMPVKRTHTSSTSSTGASVMAIDSVPLAASCDPPLPHAARPSRNVAMAIKLIIVVFITYFLFMRANMRCNVGRSPIQHSLSCVSFVSRARQYTRPTKIIATESTGEL